MADLFKTHTQGLDSPPSRLTEVTPDDSAELPFASRALNVATSGTVRVTTVDGDTGTVFVSSGIALPLRVRRVWATGTSATGIVALY
ncbi:spike base protein, RCAP_Rcc01079 family [Rhodovulum kholense]|uniref:Uncharacterized protein n=1 Tax=Rhodovulum kholense TaxID=453584 RepID=A0A8E2VGL2_9RHOB|nr:hypothetical protein [Rhodovulum kholense]PTW44021.1 hypothetical protein C8N38_11920 [Rhodovulum kholense]